MKLSNSLVGIVYSIAGFGSLIAVTFLSTFLNKKDAFILMNVSMASGMVENYVTISPSRSVRCETNKPPAMRVRVEGYTKKLQTRYNKGVQANCKAKGENMAQKAHSLSHTKWMCKYHIVFTPKYRRKIIYN